MNKRFALTTAGIASVAAGGAASAELITVFFHNDYYIAENSWQISNSAGDTIASMYVASGSLFVTGSAIVSYGFGYFDPSATSPLSSGYITAVILDVAAGDYTVAMQDTWGDGWVWNNATGSDAFTYEDTTIAFTTGGSTSGTFTVVPAPGALALLGLAGLAGRRKRN